VMGEVYTESITLLLNIISKWDSFTSISFRKGVV